MMRADYFFALCFACIPLTGFAADSVYCPQNHGYINVGMTNDQVMKICGQPTVKQDSNTVQVSEKIPVTQLIYTTLNEGAVYPGLDSYYTMWSLPSGSNGTSLRVSIVNDKVTAFSINGSDTNAMTICGNVDIQVGDDASKVYSACGSPSLVNNTFINQPVPKKLQPEVWVYQPNQYQSTIRLTFINGKLQSIE